MIRFKVVKASRLLLVLSVIFFFSAVALILFLNSGKPEGNRHTDASLISTETAETREVFAVSGGIADKLSLDPERRNDGLSYEILNAGKDSITETNPVRILIYHTHTHEAYSQTDSDPYKAIEAWRTMDSGHSVVRVGSELSAILRNMGFEVVHDTTDHEGNDLSTAYDRSLVTLESYDEPFDLCIDLHRDAYYQGLQKNHIGKSGEASAQIMMLIGNGEGFDIKPPFEENRIFAKKLTQRIEKQEPGICREVLVKNGRYNQHIGVFSVLVEVGHNLNTLQEALNAVPALANGIYDLMIRNPDIQLTAIQAER